LSLLICDCTSAPTTNGSPAGESRAPDYARERQLSDWRTAWNFVNDNFYDPALNGVEWERIRDEVAAKIEAGLDWEAFHELLRETLTVFRDGHTLYLPPDPDQDFQADTAGKSFGGLGFFVTKGKGEYISIVLPFKDGPAADAGLEPHDRILSIDQGPALDLRGYPAIGKLRGPAGSTVRLRIASPKGERDIDLVREQVTPSGSFAQGRIIGEEPGGGRRVGYIVLAGLIAGSARDLRAEFARLSAATPLDGLILDLRTNDGGLPEEVSSTLGLFIEGVFGADLDRKGDLKILATTEQALLNSRSLPLALLISETTNSAAEIVAAGLKGRGRAILVGEKTAGGLGEGRFMHLASGGTITVSRRVFMMADGSAPAWLHQGIEPDFFVAGSSWDESFDGDDPAIKAALERMTAASRN
jgi:C-terminal peptidase prc